MKLQTRRPGVAARTGRRLIGMALLLALLSGCATGSGYPGQGSGVRQSYPGGSYPDQSYPGQAYPDQGYPSYPDQYPGQSYPNQPYPGGQYGSQPITGSVDRIDQNGQRLLLVTQEPGYGRASTREVLIDRNTRLFYRGQQYPVQGLERGDVVQVDVRASQGRLWARTIEVVRNVRDGYGDPYGDAPYASDPRDPYRNDPYRDPYASDPYRNEPYRGDAYGNDPYRQPAPVGGALAGDAGGIVAYVDVSSRIVHLAPGSAWRGSPSTSTQALQVRYDQGTRAEYQGRSFDPGQLQRGDEVMVQTRQTGGTLVADRIVVQRRGR